jgi:hypothetical protein
MTIFRWLLDVIRALLEWLFRHSGGGGTIPDDKCCFLATNVECQWVGSKSDFTCPPGYHRHWWYCCEGTQQIACAECTNLPDSCWVGDQFVCSIWWYTGRSC